MDVPYLFIQERTKRRARPVGRGNPLQEAFAASRMGGIVTVVGQVVGGDGGLQPSSNTSAGNGGDAVVVDRVGGSTSGQLTLRQEAFAGDAGRGRDGALAGNAVSSLTRSAHSDRFELSTTSQGGAGSERAVTNNRGGDAASFSSAENETGEVTVNAAATGGQGGNQVSFSPGVDGGDGGDADAQSLSTSLAEAANAMSNATALGGPMPSYFSTGSLSASWNSRTPPTNTPRSIRRSGSSCCPPRRPSARRRIRDRQRSPTPCPR